MTQKHVSGTNANGAKPKGAVGGCLTSTDPKGLARMLESKDPRKGVLLLEN